MSVQCFAQSTQRIEQLDLSHNSFASKAGEILGPAIAENTSIKELNLSWNHFRGPGAIALARGIGVNNKFILIVRFHTSLYLDIC